MYTFTSYTTMAFESKEAIEAFVQGLPLSAKEKNSLLKGDTVTDDDEVSFPGNTAIVHTFTITEDK